MATATRTRRPRLPKLSETELLMLFNVDVYEIEFRHVNELETRPFTWCKEGYILNADERAILAEYDMVPWEPECYRYDCRFSNWMQASRARAKLEAHRYLELNRIDRKAMLYRVTPAGKQWLTDSKAELTELGKDYELAKKNAVFDKRFGPDPDWVRTGKLSLMEARGMVAELAKWIRGMECLQEDEVAKLADRMDKVLR